MDLKLRSEKYIFWEERKKGTNFQCKNVWKIEKNSDKLDFIPINGRRACQCKNVYHKTKDLNIDNLRFLLFM